MTKPIRILHVFGSLNRGGAESRTMDIYRAIDRNKVQFDFVVHEDKQGFFEPEIKKLGGYIYHSMPRFRIINIFKCKRKWTHLLSSSKHEYACIHIHTTNMALPALIAAKKMGIKCRICHARNASESGFIRRLIAFFLQKPLRNLSTHRFAVSDLAGRFTFSEDYEVKKNAINAGQFMYDDNKRNSIRQKLSINNEFVIGNIARFHEQKNHMFLIDVFAEVLKQIPHARLLLVGEGDLRQGIERKISLIGLSNKVVLLGERSDIPDLLQAFDLFLMPSLYEGLPGASTEAQAAGLSCFLSVAITPEAQIIKDLVTYIPINKGIKPWVDEIIKFAKNPPKRKSSTGEMKSSGYDIEEVAKWYENFYLKLIYPL